MQVWGISDKQADRLGEGALSGFSLFPCLQFACVIKDALDPMRFFLHKSQAAAVLAPP
jgi:hypothetical protein